jgi:hypothetical protein
MLIDEPIVSRKMKQRWLDELQCTSDIGGFTLDYEATNQNQL